MNRSYQTSFCKACKHGVFDRQQGIICGLIHGIPSFTDSCADYERDFEKILERRDDLRNKRTMGSSPNYTREFKAKFRPKVPYRVSVSHSTLFLTALGLNALVIFKIGDFPFSLIIGLLLLLNLGLFIYYKKHQLNKKSIYLDSKGIKVNGIFREWKDYIGYYYKRTEIQTRNGVRYGHQLEIELVGVPDNFKFDFAIFTDCKENILKALYWYEKKYSNK